MTIGAADGRFRGMHRSRAWVVELYSRARPERVALDDRVLPEGGATWRHDGIAFATIRVPRGSRERRVEVTYGADLS